MISPHRRLPGETEAAFIDRRHAIYDAQLQRQIDAILADKRPSPLEFFDSSRGIGDGRYGS